MIELDEGLEIRMSNREERCDPAEKVVMVMDVRNIVCRQNLEYTNTKIDYAKLKKDILNGRKDVAAIAVDAVKIDSRGKDANRIFHDELRRAGFRVILVEASNNKGKQDGADVMVAIQAMKYAIMEKCDTVELITGDGDFKVLAEELQGFCVNVAVRSLFGNLSYALSDQADEVHLLDSHPLVRMSPKAAEVM